MELLPVFFIGALAKADHWSPKFDGVGEHITVVTLGSGPIDFRWVA